MISPKNLKPSTHAVVVDKSTVADWESSKGFYSSFVADGCKCPSLESAISALELPVNRKLTGTFSIVDLASGETVKIISR